MTIERQFLPWWTILLPEVQFAPPYLPCLDYQIRVGHIGEPALRHLCKFVRHRTEEIAKIAEAVNVLCELQKLCRECRGEGCTSRTPYRICPVCRGTGKRVATINAVLH